MPTFATAADVAVRLGREATTEETLLIEARLGDVERKIRRRIKDLDDRISAGTTDVEDVKQVEADAVVRLVRNPEGYLQETDGNYSYMLSREMASGKLEILDEEWAALGWRRLGMAILVPTFELPT